MAKPIKNQGTYSAETQFSLHAYENSLPIPEVIDTAKRDHITLQVRQTSQFLGLYDFNGNPLYTTVWGYGTGQTATYPGPTILAYEDHPSPSTGRTSCRPRAIFSRSTPRSTLPIR